MNLLSLVLVNLGRNKRRTILTLLSVMVALFLFCTLGGVLDTLQESIKVGSETRLIRRKPASLEFQSTNASAIVAPVPPTLTNVVKNP